MPRFQEQRDDRAQRDAVEHVLSRATGATAVLHGEDGSVFVYDEHREWEPPATLRVRINNRGDIDPSDRLRYGEVVP